MIYVEFLTNATQKKKEKKTIYIYIYIYSTFGITDDISHNSSFNFFQDLSFINILWPSEQI